MCQMHDATVEMIGPERAAVATRLPSWTKHEMHDDQLAAPVEAARDREAPATPPGMTRARTAGSCHGRQAYSTSRRALSPRWNVGTPPGTRVASRTSNNSSDVP